MATLRAAPSPEKAIGIYWCLVAIATICMARWAGRAAALMPPCLFRSVTGLPCPTCGATRAILALSRFDFATAIAHNPLAVLAAVAFLVGGIAAGIAALAGRPLREPRPWRCPPVARTSLLLAVAINWVWLLARYRHG